MNNKIKTYKILVDSKLFANIRGSTPAEVAKKAASKILGNSLNRTRFEIQENSKIRHYDAKLENLVRPYRKNGKLVKYRIVVKKLGKQVGGTYPPNLEPGSKDPIFDFFPIEEYSIKIDNSRPFPEIMIDKDEGDVLCACVHFYIQENSRTLTLNTLSKCNDKTGSINLMKLIGYANYLKESGDIDKIVLGDASIINIGNYDLSLPLLSILSTGMSWYNRFGFFSEDHMKDLEYNRQFLEMNLEDFLNRCIPKKLEIKIKYYQEILNAEIQKIVAEIKTEKDPRKQHFKMSILQKLAKNKSERNSFSSSEGLAEKINSELISKVQEFISIFEDKKVQVLFNEIKDELKNPVLPPQKLKEIAELFKFIKSSGIIRYNVNLTKEL